MAPKGVVVASSPGRAAEKLPGPQGLARLLSRTGGGGRSRARSSPMFAARSKSVGRSSSAAAATGAVVEGEPSSPKVTCIGQVRIKKKKAGSKEGEKTVTAPPVAPAPVRCQCLQRSLLCSLFTIRKKKKKKKATGGSGGGGPPRKLWWPRWGLNLRSGARGGAYNKQRKAEAVPEKPPLEMVGGGRGSWFQEREEEGEQEERTERSEEEEEEETRVFAPSSAASTTPPQNALLLMRCRSAPHNRSSSLATPRFSVSSLPELESAAEEGNSGEGAGEGETEDGKRRKSSNGSSRNEEEVEEEEEEEEEEELRCSSSRPLVLTRSKSEPASTAAKLVAPEAAAPRFWPAKDGTGSRQRLLALVDEEEQRSPPLLLR